MKILAIDHGTKRIGLAISDELGITAKALPVLKVKNEKQALQKILEIIEKENCEKILIGNPSGYANTKSAQSWIVQDFANSLKEKTSAEIIFWDESYSSADASRVMQRAGQRRRRGEPVDDVAAAAILQDYLDAGGSEREPGQPLEDLADQA